MDKKRTAMLKKPANKEAFIRLVDEHRGLIYKVCHSFCPNPDEPRDDRSADVERLYDFIKELNELDNLKRSWEQYDQRLTENLRLNKELLRRSNLDRSRREMSTPLNFTGFNLAVVPLVFLVSLRWTLMYGHEPLDLICGIVVMAMCLLSLAVDLKGMGILRSIDYDNTPVLELQKRLTAFKALYNTDKKIGIYLLPLFLAAT